MHRVFTIPYLTEEIVRWLDAKADQVRFGLASKLVWSVAKREIWRELVGGGRAFLFLAPDEITIVDIYHEPRAILSRPLTELEWRPFLDYGPLIRILDVSDSEESGAPYIACPIALAILSTYSGSIPLFPRLVEISLRLKLSESIVPSISLVRRRLRKLWLKVDCLAWMEFGQSVHRLIRAAVQSPEDLEVVDIRLAGHVDSWFDVISGSLRTVKDDFAFLISRLGRVKSLTLWPIGDGASLFPLLGTLPSLEKLHVGINNIQHPIEHYTLPADAFPSLRHLLFKSINSLHHPQYDHLLGSVSSQCLEYCKLSARDLESLCAALHVLASRWSFTLVGVTIEIAAYRQEPAISLPFETLLRLARCPALQTLRVDGAVQLDFTDTHFTLLAQTWPTLKCLWLQPDMAHVPSAGQHALRILAAMLPLLHYLVVSINFDIVGQPTAAMPKPEQSSLPNLVCTASRCSRPDAAVHLLRTVFPGLCTFQGDGLGMREVCLALDLPGEATPLKGLFCF